MHEMRRKRKIREENIDKQVEEIERFKDNAKMYEVIKNIRRKPLDNPYIHDTKGRRVMNPKEIHSILYGHFKDKFFKPEEEVIEPFDCQARKLNIPITEAEVKISVKKLNNRRASRKDEIYAELIKYGPDLLIKMIEVLNLIFVKTSRNRHSIDTKTKRSTSCYSSNNNTQDIIKYSSKKNFTEGK